MQKAAEYFNVDSKSILNNLDTKLATNKNGILVLIFIYELTDQDKESIVHTQKPKNETTAILVYKIINVNLNPISNNKPTFGSKQLAAK